MRKLMRTRIVSQDESDKLLEKQWRARIYLFSCPFRKALNQRWRVLYNNRLKSKNMILKLFEN